MPLGGCGCGWVAGWLGRWVEQRRVGGGWVGRCGGGWVGGGRGGWVCITWPDPWTPVGGVRVPAKFSLTPRVGGCRGSGVSVGARCLPGRLDSLVDLPGVLDSPEHSRPSRAWGKFTPGPRQSRPSLVGRGRAHELRGPLSCLPARSSRTSPRMWLLAIITRVSRAALTPFLSLQGSLLVVVTSERPVVDCLLRLFGGEFELLFQAEICGIVFSDDSSPPPVFNLVRDMSSNWPETCPEN